MLCKWQSRGKLGLANVAEDILLGVRMFEKLILLYKTATWNFNVLQVAASEYKAHASDALADLLSKLTRSRKELACCVTQTSGSLSPKATHDGVYSNRLV